MEDSQTFLEENFSRGGLGMTDKEAMRETLSHIK